MIKIECMKIKQFGINQIKIKLIFPHLQYRKSSHV